MKQSLRITIVCCFSAWFSSHAAHANGGHGGTHAHAHSGATGGATGAVGGGNMGGQVSVGGFSHHGGTAGHSHGGAAGHSHGGLNSPVSGGLPQTGMGQSSLGNSIGNTISNVQSGLGGHRGTNNLGGTPQAGGFGGPQTNFNPAPSLGTGTGHRPGHVPPNNLGMQGNPIGTAAPVGNSGGISAHPVGFNPVEFRHPGFGHHHPAGAPGNLHHPYQSNQGNASDIVYQPMNHGHGARHHGNWGENRGQGNLTTTGATTSQVSTSVPQRGHHHGSYGGTQGGYWPGIWASSGTSGLMIYDSGYVDYMNPYYSSMDLSGGAYNYMRPVPVYYAAQPVAKAPTRTVAAATNYEEILLSSAIGAFQRGDYETALDVTDLGIGMFPDDAVLHEFRALVLFAKGDYQPAAATLHAVLAVGPGWNWATLIGFYRNPQAHTDQLRALEFFIKKNPQNAAARFLLAYHYMASGFSAAAGRQFSRVVDLEPSDRVAVDLLKMVSEPKPNALTQPVEQPTPEPPPADLPSPEQTRPKSNAVPVDPTTIIGTWTATREDGSAFNLVLNEDKTFTWKFLPRNQPAQSFSGAYSLDTNLLLLERFGGGKLVAEITPVKDARFHFKMAGGPATDPGLDFAR